jgi:hypothetical protein
VACRIVFSSGAGLIVDGDAQETAAQFGQADGLVRVAGADGKHYWVNPATVQYVEPLEDRQSRSPGFG